MQWHNVRFFRCVDDPGTHRAVCSCGWAIMGDPEHVRSHAVTHDIDEAQEQECLQQHIAQKQDFVSGLPDDDYHKHTRKTEI